jgi:hypothetical protein
MSDMLQLVVIMPDPQVHRNVARGICLLNCWKPERWELTDKLKHVGHLGAGFLGA